MGLIIRVDLDQEGVEEGQFEKMVMPKHVANLLHNEVLAGYFMFTAADDTISS